MVKATDTLLDVLREKLGVVSPKRGCDTGECGTCTVILNGEPVRACLTIALTAEGKKVETLEGLTQDGKMHPLQEAFHEHYAAQCGFCTPGMVMSAKASWIRNRNPAAKRSWKPFREISAAAAAITKSSKPLKPWPMAAGRSEGP